MVTSLDVTKCITLVELSCNMNSLTSLDLTHNANLTKLECSNNDLSAGLDLSANTKLARLTATNCGFSALDLSHNAALTYLSLNNNNFTSIDVTGLPLLASLYIIDNQLESLTVSNANTKLSNVSVNNNKLTSLDVSSLPALAYLFAIGNSLTSINIGNITKTVNISNNCLTFATLPTSSAKTFTYAPQKALTIADAVKAEVETIDLSAQNNITGLATEAQATVYTWKQATSNTALTADTDYTVANGVTTFLTEQADSVYCTMTSAAFPKLTLQTTKVAVKENAPAITLTAQVDGNTRSFDFYSTTTGTTLQIDWGDGTLVETAQIADPDALNYTTVTGTPTGNGVIKIYGDNIKYFDCVSKKSTAMITSLDVSKCATLDELLCNMNSLTSLDLTHNANLTKLECSNNDLSAGLDLSANTQLARLTATNCGFSTLDLSHNAALTYISLNDNSLTSLDVTGLPLLANLYILNNQLESLTVSDANAKLSNVSVNNNKLTSLDVSSLPALAYLFAIGNSLTSINIGNITKTVNISNNCLTFATLPTSSARTFTYAPQKALAIADAVKAEVETVDLSAQDNITGLATEAQATVYTWKQATSNTALTADTDYTVANGVTTFLTEQADSVYCTMTSAAFPKLTLQTTKVKITDKSGVESISSAKSVVTSNQGAINVTCAAGEDISVYSINGALVFAMCPSPKIGPMTIRLKFLTLSSL